MSDINTQKILTKVLSMELMLGQLLEMCYTTKAELENATSPVPPKGRVKKTVAKAIEARMKNIRVEN